MSDTIEPTEAERNLLYEQAGDLSMPRSVKRLRAHVAAEVAKATAEDRAKIKELLETLTTWSETDEDANWVNGFSSLANALKEEADDLRAYLNKAARAQQKDTP